MIQLPVSKSIEKRFCLSIIELSPVILPVTERYKSMTDNKKLKFLVGHIREYYARDCHITDLINV